MNALPVLARQDAPDEHSAGVGLVTAPGTSSREARIVIMESVLRGIRHQAWSPTSDWAGVPPSIGDLPVGSVEFLQAVMAHHGFQQPPEIGFPLAIEPWLKRRIRATRAGLLGLDGPTFVKPRKSIKTFTGFVYAPGASVENEQDLFIREQLAVFLALPPEAPVWVSEVVFWQSEWRYYVLRGGIVGAGRYDAGDDEAPEPLLSEVLAAVAAFEASGEAPVGYAMDFGVLADGDTALVEINDGWALGYYTGTLTPARYLELLSARWREISGLRDTSGAPRSTIDFGLRPRLGKGYVRVTNLRVDLMPPDLRPKPDETRIMVDPSHPVLYNRHILRDRSNYLERARTVAAFRSDLAEDMAIGGPMSQAVFALAHRVVQGEKICLACWCSPRECHANVIAEVVEMLAAKEALQS